MLRQTPVALEHKFMREFLRARPLLRGRAKVEPKLGTRAVRLRLQKYTRFRTNHKSYDQRTRVRADVDAAAVEHGTGWAHIRNDLSRQAVHLFPTTQRLLAQYEPLAFRSMMELCSARIAPPSCTLNNVPIVPRSEMNALKPDIDRSKQSTPAADLHLQELIANMIHSDNAVINLSANGTSSALRRVKINGITPDNSKVLEASRSWMEAWKDFENIDESVRTPKAVKAKA